MAEKTEEQKRLDRQRALDAARRGQTEVSTAERGTETSAVGTSEAAGGYRTRETMKMGPKPAPETESGVKDIVARAGAAGAAAPAGMPTQGNWQQRFPGATSFFDAVRLWREGKREEAAPQKKAIQRALGK